MSEWIPSDKELIEVLCRVRETDWKWADYRANRALAKMSDGTIKYDNGAPFGEYGEYLWKRQNYPEILGYMLTPKAWRCMTLPEVLNDIFSREGADANGNRQSLLKAIDDYRFAAKIKLLEVLRWEKDSSKCRFMSTCPLCTGTSENLKYIAADKRLQIIQDSKDLSGEHLRDEPVSGYFIDFLGGAGQVDYVESDVIFDEHLIKKIVACQTAKSLILERMSLEQAGASEADGSVDHQAQNEAKWAPIKWLKTSEELELLSNNLLDMGFISDVHEFAGQFNKSDRKAEKKCQWLGSDRLLGYLLEKLWLKGRLPKDLEITKTAKGHFLKKNGADFTNSLKNNLYNQKNLNPSPIKESDLIDEILSKSLT